MKSVEEYARRAEHALEESARSAYGTTMERLTARAAVWAQLAHVAALRERGDPDERDV